MTADNRKVYALYSPYCSLIYRKSDTIHASVRSADMPASSWAEEFQDNELGEIFVEITLDKMVRATEAVTHGERMTWNEEFLVCVC
jgi:hypothetical protein